MNKNKEDIDFEKRFDELKKFLMNKGILFSEYQNLIFKLIDSIDKLPIDTFNLSDIMRFEFFKEVVKEMDGEFENNS